MAVDYAITACLVFLESLSHLSSIPPCRSIPGRGGGDACPSSEFQKQYWRRGHTHVAVGILLYCIAIFHVAVTVSTYFHVICQQLPSVLCCRFKTTLLVGIFPYMTGAWLWVWHLVWLWTHTTFQHFKILWKAPTSPHFCWAVWHMSSSGEFLEKKSCTSTPTLIPTSALMMPVTASTMRALVITVSRAVSLLVTFAACPIPSLKT